MAIDPKKKDAAPPDPLHTASPGVAAGMAALGHAPAQPVMPGVRNAPPRAPGAAKPVPMPAPGSTAPAAPAATLQRNPTANQVTNLNVKPPMPAPAPAPAPPAPGTKIGHLTLVPGSGLDTAVKAVGGFFAGTKAKNDAMIANQEARTAASGGTLNNGMGGSPPAAKPTPTPAAKAATPTLARAQPVAPAAPAQGAVVAPAAPAVAAAAVPAAPTPTLKPGDVNSYTNGAGVTRAVPGMTAQPGTAPAQTVAAPSAPVAAAGLSEPVTAPVAQAPGVSLSRSLSGDLSGAERERQALRSDLDSRLFGLGTLNSRGKRAMAMQIADQQYGLTKDRIDQVTGLETEGARLQSSADEQNAAIAADVNQGNADRQQRASDTASAATLRRAEIDAAAKRPESQVVNQDGTLSLVRGDGSITAATDANGKPITPRDTAGSITEADLFKAYSDELSGINENALLKPEDRQAQIAELKGRPEYRAILERLASAPPAAAIQHLKQNPSLAADFDAKFGKGAAAKILGN